MAQAKASLVTFIKAGAGKKCHIKIFPPSGSQFKTTTDINSVRDRDNGFTWTAAKLPSSNRKRLKFVIKRDAFASDDTAEVLDPGLPDAGTITITLSDPPIDIDPIVEDLEVDYVDGSD
jgi:hypothetical protein